MKRKVKVDLDELDTALNWGIVRREQLAVAENAHPSDRDAICPATGS